MASGGRQSPGMEELPGGSRLPLAGLPCRRIIFQQFLLRSVVGEFTPDDKPARRAGFYDAPLLAEPNHAARQILLANASADEKLRRIMHRVERTARNFGGQTKGRFGRVPLRTVVGDDVVFHYADHGAFRA